MLNYFINHRFEDIIFNSACSIFNGDRGSGKSTLMAYANDIFQKHKYRVFSNYPYNNALKIPYKEIPSKYGTKLVLDKEFLYKSDLSNSLVIIDEARTVWNSRSYASWNENDEEFFNFIRKNNTFVILGTQRFDGLDLNIRCACDYTFFIQRSRFFKNTSWIDVSKACQLKVSDKNSQIVSRGYTKNANKVIWDIGEIPILYHPFYRKPFYNKFDTNFVNNIKEEPLSECWQLDEV